MKTTKLFFTNDLICLGGYEYQGDYYASEIFSLPDEYVSDNDDSIGLAGKTFDEISNIQAEAAIEKFKRDRAAKILLKRDGVVASLTANEKALLKASRTNDYCDAVEDDSPWVFAVIQSSRLDPKVARGAIASLVKKGLVIIGDYEGKGRDHDMYFELTDLGKEVTVELTTNS